MSTAGLVAAALLLGAVVVGAVRPPRRGLRVAFAVVSTTTVLAGLWEMADAIGSMTT